MKVFFFSLDLIFLFFFLLDDSSSFGSLAFIAIKFVIEVRVAQVTLYAGTWSNVYVAVEPDGGSEV